MNYIFLAAALVLTAILIPVLIPLLKRMKFGQSIREEGPKSHLIKEHRRWAVCHLSQ